MATNWLVVLKAYVDTLETIVGTEGGVALANKLTAARAAFLDASIAGRAAENGGKLENTETFVIAIAAGVTATNSYLINLPKYQHEVEWSSVPAIDQVASVDATSLTTGSITPTFPTDSTRIRAILIANIHAANQSANTQGVKFKVQGKKDAGAYADQIDLTAQNALGMVNLIGAGDGVCVSKDVTALVDASDSTYLFKFIVTASNAGAVNYTSSFVLIIVYKI